MRLFHSLSLHLGAGVVVSLGLVDITEVWVGGLQVGRGHAGHGGFCLRHMAAR